MYVKLIRIIAFCFHAIVTHCSFRCQSICTSPKLVLFSSSIHSFRSVVITFLLFIMTLLRARGRSPRGRVGDPSDVIWEVNSVNDAAVTLFESHFSEIVRDRKVKFWHNLHSNLQFVLSKFRIYIFDSLETMCLFAT